MEEKKKPTISFNPALFITNRDKVIRAYDEMDTKLIQLTGYDIEKLVELFAAGYTLQPPKYMSFADLEKECE